MLTASVKKNAPLGLWSAVTALRLFGDRAVRRRALSSLRDSAVKLPPLPNVKLRQCY